MDTDWDPDTDRDPDIVQDPVIDQDLDIDQDSDTVAIGTGLQRLRARRQRRPTQP